MGIFDGFAGAMFGGLSGLLGAKDTNQQSSGQFKKQFKLQNKLAHSGYQIAAQDLKAAGINPILAGKWGPASASAVALPNLINPGASMMEGVNTGMQAVKQKEEIDNINVDEEIKKIDLKLKENILPGSRAARELFEVVENTIIHVKRVLDIDDYGGVANKFEKASYTLQEAIQKLDSLGENTEKLKAIMKEILRFSPLRIPLGE
jgi:hypothetical protein